MTVWVRLKGALRARSAPLSGRRLLCPGKGASGCSRDKARNPKANGNYYNILGFYWDSLGIMEKKMETTIWGLGFRV